MTKKTLTEKQKAKKEAKAEREKIVNKYIDEIKQIIDNGYVEMSLHLDDFNKELEESAIEYGNMKTTILKLLKTEIQSIDLIEETMNKVIAFEEKNLEIYNTITSRDMKENKLLSKLPNIAEKVANTINKAFIDLENHKNQAYIVSMITNRSFDEFKQYNSYIIDVALESNSYIDCYIDAREDFLEFIDECRAELEEKQKQYETNIQIEKISKYNQRLRVDYTELASFLKHKGFECDRQGSTTHAVWRHTETGKSLPLPNKSGTIPQGTTSKVLKQMGSNRNELAQFLYA